MIGIASGVGSLLLLFISLAYHHDILMHLETKMQEKRCFFTASDDDQYHYDANAYETLLLDREQILRVLCLFFSNEVILS